MPTDPIEGGYNDRYLLNKAIRHNRQCREVLGQLIENRLGAEGVNGLLLILAYELGQQAETLHEEWTRIRPRRQED